jgi:hypothetical protein
VLFPLLVKRMAVKTAAALGISWQVGGAMGWAASEVKCPCAHAPPADERIGASG